MKNTIMFALLVVIFLVACGPAVSSPATSPTVVDFAQFGHTTLDNMNVWSGKFIDNDTGATCYYIIGPTSVAMSCLLIP